MRHMLRPGDTVRGHTISALLGEGGMARVYAATRELDGMQVALKVLHQTREEAAQRALREAEAQQALDHPHVVRVLDVIDLDGSPALVMERVNGPSLRQWLASGRPTEEEALTLFRGVLSGVAAAHRQGLIHRDLKPGNVLLSVEDAGLVPKVADFGLAKSADPAAFTTRTGMMLGTPGYMAPEQIRDAKRVDARADVYSLGVLLYELACGARPFSGHDVVGVYGDMMARAYASPTSLGASPALASAIERALSPEAQERPADASALRMLLDPGATFLDELDDRATVLSWQYPGAQRARSLASLPDGAVDPMLPALRTPIAAPEGGLVGREEALDLLGNAVQQPGLVTLRGPAGVGKTTVMRGLCHQQGPLKRSWPGGIWWVGLRDMPDPSAAIAEVLGVPKVAEIGAALASRSRLLLVLDEAENAVDPLSAVLEGWLADAPDLTILVSSRRSLGLPSERTQALGPLGAADAVALFTRRARGHRPNWRPTPEERGQLRELVDALDRLPLAIELAAARARLLSPAELLDRLSRRLDLLRRRNPDPRAASLRGAIQESWDLLEPVERQAMRWLSTARGDIAAGAADALLLVHDPDPLTLIESLVDASWLSPRRGRDGPRFRLLASLRDFAREQLSDADQPQAWADHRDAWLPRAQRAAKAFRATGDPDASALLSEELEDILAIADRFPDTRHATQARLIAGRWLHERGAQQRAAAIAMAAAGAKDTGGAEIAEAHLLLAETLAKLKPAIARAAAEKAAELAPDDRMWAWAQVALATTEENTPGPEADLAAAIEIARMLEDLLLEAAARMQISTRHLIAGRFSDAEEAAEEAQALYREANHRPRQATALSMMGLTRIRAQRPAQAEEPLRQAVAAAAELGDRRSQADALGRLSMVLAQSGRRDEARASLQEALALCRQTGNRVGEGYCLVNLGAMEPEPAHAADLFRRAGAVARRAGNVRLQNLAQRNVGSSELLRGLPARAIQAFEQVRQRLLDNGDGDAVRVGAWLAMALIADEQPDRDLLAVQAQGEDGAILAMAQLMSRARADPSLDWPQQMQGIIDAQPSFTWDLRLTKTLLEALLTPPEAR